MISNLPTGDLTYLDADYTFRLTNTEQQEVALAAPRENETRAGSDRARLS